MTDQNINSINPRDYFSGVYVKKENSEFEDEYEVKIPQLQELQFVANKNRDCQYFYSGIEFCRRKVTKFLLNPKSQGYDGGYLACKSLVDQHYRCLTQDKYGQTLDEAPEETQKDVQEFYQCAFQQLKPMHHCKKYLDGVFRSIVRLPDTQIDES